MKTFLLSLTIAVAVALAAPHAAHAQDPNWLGAAVTTAGWVVLGGPIELTFDVTDVVLAAQCTTPPTWYGVLEAVFGAAEVAQVILLASILTFRNFDDAAAGAAILSPFAAVGIAHVVHAMWPLIFHQQPPRGVDLGVHATPQAAIVEARFAL